MSIIALIVTAVGAALSVAKDRRCFIMWLGANGYWIWFNWPGIQSCVFVVMSVTCIVGWFAWKKERGTADKRLEKEVARQAKHVKLIQASDDSSTTVIGEMDEEIARLRDENEKFRLGWTIAQDKIIELKDQLGD